MSADLNTIKISPLGSGNFSNYIGSGSAFTYGFSALEMMFPTFLFLTPAVLCIIVTLDEEERFWLVPVRVGFVFSPLPLLFSFSIVLSALVYCFVWLCSFFFYLFISPFDFRTLLFPVRHLLFLSGRCYRLSCSTLITTSFLALKCQEIQCVICLDC